MLLNSFGMKVVIKNSKRAKKNNKERRER